MPEPKDTDIPRAFDSSAASLLSARREFGPAEAAAVLEKLHRPFPCITDKSKSIVTESILIWADRTIEALAVAQTDEEVFRSDECQSSVHKTALKLAVATLDALNLPKETRKVIDTGIEAAFRIGIVLGDTQQALHARKDMTRARAELMQMGQAIKSTGRVKARHARELEFIKDKKWSLDREDLPGKLQDMLGVDESTGKLVPPSTIRRDIKALCAITR